MFLIMDTSNILSYCFSNYNYSTVLLMEDSQETTLPEKESSHSPLQLVEFEGAFYKL